jgi:hypothetical protein
VILIRATFSFLVASLKRMLSMVPSSEVGKHEYFAHAGGDRTVLRAAEQKVAMKEPDFLKAQLRQTDETSAPSLDHLIDRAP